MTRPAALPFFYYQTNLAGQWSPAKGVNDPRRRLSRTTGRAAKVRLLPENMRGLSLGVLSLIYPPPGVGYVGAPQDPDAA